MQKNITKNYSRDLSKKTQLYTHLHIQSPLQVVVGRQSGRKLTQDATNLCAVLQIELR